MTLAVSVFFNLRVVRSRAKHSIPICVFLDLRSHSNLPCLVNLTPNLNIIYDIYGPDYCHITLEPLSYAIHVESQVSLLCSDAQAQSETLTPSNRRCEGIIA